MPDFFSSTVATMKVWEFIILVALILVSVVFLMGYIGGKIEEQSTKKSNQPTPNTGVPANPQVGANSAPPALPNLL